MKNIGDAIVTIKSRINPSVQEKIYVHYVAPMNGSSSSIYCNNKYVGYVFSSNKAVLLYEVLSTPTSYGSLFKTLFMNYKESSLTSGIPDGEEGSRTDGKTNTQTLNSKYGFSLAQICNERGGWLPAIEEVSTIYNKRTYMKEAFPAIAVKVDILTYLDDSGDYRNQNSMVSSTYTGSYTYEFVKCIKNGAETNTVIKNQSYDVWTVVNPK